MGDTTRSMENRHQKCDRCDTESGEKKGDIDDEYVTEMEMYEEYHGNKPPTILK